MRLLPLNCIKDEALLARSLYDCNGNLILSSRCKLNQKRIQMLRDKGFKSVYIIDNYSNEIIDDLIKPELRLKASSTVKNTFYEFTKNPNSSQKSMSNLKNIANELLDELLSKKNILINLVDIKMADDYTYSHSVNVAVLSLVIGISLNLNVSQLYELSLGALLHDVGKIFIPNEILNKPTKLDENEMTIMKSHVRLGFEYLQKYHPDIPAISKSIALQHHLWINGEGYPENFPCDKFHLFSQIVSISDVYDALTSDRAYKDYMPANDAIEYIMSKVNKQFSMNLVKTFVQKIVPYPVGSIVKLSDGSVATIHKLNENYPLRPVVEKIYNKKLTGNFIDLMKNYNILIDKIVYELF